MILEFDKVATVDLEVLAAADLLLPLLGANRRIYRLYGWHGQTQAGLRFRCHISAVSFAGALGVGLQRIAPQASVVESAFGAASVLETLGHTFCCGASRAVVMGKNRSSKVKRGTSVAIEGSL